MEAYWSPKEHCFLAVFAVSDVCLSDLERRVSQTPWLPSRHVHGGALSWVQRQSQVLAGCRGDVEKAL